MDNETAFEDTDRLTSSVEEAAAALGIGRRLAYEAIARGELPAIRVGRRLLVPRVALAAMLSGPVRPDSGPA